MKIKNLWNRHLEYPRIIKKHLRNNETRSGNERVFRQVAAIPPATLLVQFYLSASSKASNFPAQGSSWFMTMTSAFRQVTNSCGS